MWVSMWHALRRTSASFHLKNVDRQFAYNGVKLDGSYKSSRHNIAI
jgi:hypothetical protein